MEMNSDYLIGSVIILIAMFLFFKTRYDYKKQVLNKTDNNEVNPRSFYIKGVIFIFLPLAMSRSAFKTPATTVIFSLILLLGIWNIVHAFLLMRYNRKKQK